VFLEYEIYYWLVWIPITYFSARKKGFAGIILCHILIAISIFVADVILISQAMAKPNWDGTPDMDFVFMLGMLIRIFAVNIVLLPAAILGWLVKRADENT
jgi:hypothetical protein